MPEETVTMYTLDDDGHIIKEDSNALESADLPEDVQNDSVQPSENQLSSYFETVEVSEDLPSDSLDNVDAVTPYVDNPSNAVSSPPSADCMVIYNVTLSSYGDCLFVVSPESADNIEVTDDGRLINWSSSDISGSLYQGDSITDAYGTDVLRLTLLGRGSSNYASSTYRYGSSQYVTSYSLNYNNNITSSSTYVSFSAAKQQTWSFSFWATIVLVVCALLLGVNALIRLLRRGLGD